MNKTFSLLTFFLLALSIQAQTDILDARTNFDIDDEVTVTGIVTNGESLGVVRYIQDATAGIAIYPGTDWGSFDVPAMGDEITVTGLLSEFSGLLEVGPDLSTVTINSSDNPLPDPAILTPDQMNESYEGQLVTIQNCLFDSPGQPFQAFDTYSFTSGGESGVLYMRDSNPLVGELVPFCAADLTGLASQFSFDGVGGYQLLPRGTDDMNSSATICLVSSVDQENITTISFDLTWLTDAPGDSEVNYGLTPDLGTNLFIDESVTDHTISMEGLEPATVYYVQVQSTSDGETASSNVIPFITRSNSSGDITVYFTNSVDTNFADEEEAIGLFTDTNDTIAAYITRAVETVDLAIYNINDQTIVAAINEAYDNGIQIRYIAQGTNANTGLNSFNDGIPVLLRNDDNGSGMHNKFVIIDANLEDKAHVITGSTNFTTENLVSDFNNVIIFQEQSLARGFELEFNEMWGTDGPEPDEVNAKFGPDKTNNTPKIYYAGESLVETYFSPSDNTNTAILNTIQSSDVELNFCLLTFTRNDLGDAVIDVNDSFFSFAQGIIEQESNEGSEWDGLIAAGVDVYSHQNVPGQLHHKYCIVDQSSDSDDPMVLTGSHNWSTSAESWNDENTVVVHDTRIANLYYQEYRARLGAFVGVEEFDAAKQYSIYPNPAEGLFFIGNLQGKAEVRISDLTGKVISVQSVSSTQTVNIETLSNGTYLVQIISDLGVEGHIMSVEH